MLGTESVPGIIPLALEDLFSKIFIHAQSTGNEYDVSLSYLEIYNENIRDLLSGNQDHLDLKDDGVNGVVVSGIECVSALSANEVLSYLKKGSKNRSCESTSANEVSSRSHAIIQVQLRCKTTEGGKEGYRISKLSMIDLAGSGSF